MQHAPAIAHPADHTSTGLSHRKVLMWAFLSSDCLFFGTLITTYMVYRGHSLVGPYPTDLFDIPFTTVSTFVLLTSSLTMVLALAAAQRNDHKKTAIWLLATAVLGLWFLGGQAYEFSHFVHEGLTLQHNLFGATFFVLTGFHGAHVTIGVFWLLGLFGTALRKKKSGRDLVMDIEIAGLYWHFVDIVWIVIFTLVYLVAFA